MNVLSLQETVGGRELRGTAFLPDESAYPVPTAVLQHGFGSNRMEAAGLFVQLSRALNAAGFATVAFDRAGHGESDGEFFDTTVSRDVRDAVELLDRIPDMTFVDASQVHLVGMSMGSVVSSVVAAQRSDRVRSLTLWSPAAVFVDDARSGSMQGRSVTAELERGWFDNGGVRLGPAFFEEARAFDVYGRAKGFHGPVLVMSGDADVVVPVRYAEAYAEVYGDAARITIVPGADHIWSSVPLREVLIPETVEFMTTVSAAARSW